ncbi:MAG TPA: histidine kinase, partial [Segetibacter sp.]|nr:histidine kinase [Segetibacter sp.]
KYGKQSEYNSDNRIYTLYTDRNGDILAGTDAGLYYYNTHETQPELKKVYNADNGLRGDVATSIKEDTKGDIWCITGSALCKINKQTDNITTFRKQDGIDKINLLNGLSLFQKGLMAAFTTKGYYLFDPLSFPEKDTTGSAVITSFKIDDKEQFFENKIAAHEKIVVPANANVISFEYAALDFDRPDKQQYAYILEGSDKDWVMAGTRRYVGYSNLPGGDYVFKVKATNTPDNWNVPLVSILIHVTQPFYKTWWFILAVIAVIIVSLDTFYKFKLEKQQQILRLETKTQILQKEKALVMYESLKQQLNPHFLFNSLTSLSSLIRYDQEKAGDFLDALSKIYRYILKSRHNETVTLAEEINFVQTFIKLQQTRFDHGLIVNINIPKEFEHCKIPPVTLQNLIENAIKHNIIDEDSPLVIDIYTEDDYIIIRNNLQRKNFVETSNKQGLFNLASLYEYLSTKPVLIRENEQHFLVKIPMI